jgi:hypothetical protein
MKNNGYFGNIAALLFAYQSTASSIRNVMQDNLAETKMACFTRRPSQVFAGSQARTGIITAKKTEDGDDQAVETSRFLRFTEDNRREVFNNIEYESTEGLILGDKIDDGKDKSLPKIGESSLKDVLETLKENSDNVIGDVASRSDETQYVVWRSRHPAYFINPCLENLYSQGDIPQDFDPLYFDSEIERRAAFLSLQSSVFYLYWMVYENERDVNWKSIDSFPIPEKDELEEFQEEIFELSNELWDRMSNRFVGGSREMIEQAGALKPVADIADDLLGRMHGLTEEEIEYVKGYDEEYRLNDVNQSQLVDVSFDWGDNLREDESEEEVEAED